ncbi:MAG: peptide chain release factor N(5)-glutamine methyltransferase [Acidobacteria bacterium]|nr:peptide chain release factor N(5)-glutamine methyltransferase [Acidobacteriota bacterium]
MTLQALVREARTRLAFAGITGAEAALDADLLARHVLGWDRAVFVARMLEEAPPGFADAFEALIARRARREPVAYIRGSQEFWGRDFLVRAGVLIPRPETELIVEEALAWAGTRAPGTRLGVLDVGTGSGCLAVTLARELPGAVVFATDVSSHALAVARENARRFEAGVSLHLGAYLGAVPPPFDLVVSNPPYVTEAAYRDLQPEVRDYEPATALVGGPDGLDVARGIVRLAAKALAPGGLLLMEIGDGQAALAGQMVADAEALRLLRIRPDLQGIARVLVARR